MLPVCVPGRISVPGPHPSFAPLGRWGTDPHLVHDGRGDDDASFGVCQRVCSFRDRDPVLLGPLVLVDDVVFAADEDAGGTVEAIRRRVLPSRNCTSNDASVFSCPS